MPLRIVEKLWGREEWLVNNELYCLKRLIIIPGGCCSLHAHRIKDETFVGEIGSFMLEVDDDVMEFKFSDSFRILPMVKHRFWVQPKGLRASFLEVSTHHDDADVIRYEESKLL